MKTVLLSVCLCLALSMSAIAQTHDSMHFGPDYVTVVARHCQKYVKFVNDEPSPRVGNIILTVALGHYKVDQEACNADPLTVYMRETHTNLDTNLAKDWAAFLMSATSGVPTGGVANFLALSVNGTVNAADCPASATPATANCNMNGGGSPGTYEISTSGLVRSSAAFARTGNGVFTLTHTWTAAAAQDSSHGTPNGTIASAGVVVGGTAGTGPVLFENTFTPISMAVSDTVQITWTITQT